MGDWDGKVLVVEPGANLDALTGVLAAVVAGPDAVAVGEAVGRWQARGVRACGFVGAPGDAALQMAAELFPGSEVLLGPSA